MPDVPTSPGGDGASGSRSPPVSFVCCPTLPQRTPGRASKREARQRCRERQRGSSDARMRFVPRPKVVSKRSPSFHSFSPPVHRLARANTASSFSSGTALLLAPTDQADSVKNTRGPGRGEADPGCWVVFWGCSPVSSLSPAAASAAPAAPGQSESPPSPRTLNAAHMARGLPKRCPSLTCRYDGEEPAARAVMPPDETFLGRAKNEYASPSPKCPRHGSRPSRRELAKRLSRGPRRKEPGNAAHQHTNRHTTPKRTDQGQRKIETSLVACNSPLYCYGKWNIFPGTSLAGWLGSPGSGSSSWSFNVMHTSNVVPIRRADARFKLLFLPAMEDRRAMRRSHPGRFVSCAISPTLPISHQTPTTRPRSG